MKLRWEHMKKAITMLLFILIAVTCASAQSGVNSENQCAPNSEQRNVAVYFEVPEFIETGLIDGSMERVGGVIRYSDNQQTIAWLRRGGQMGQVAESAAGLLEHVTRLSNSRHLALGQLLASVTPVLHISMAGFSLVEHIAGIRAHEAELERIFDRVSEEFQRDRTVKLLAALAVAETIVYSTNEDYKIGAASQALFALTEARGQLLWDLDELLSAEINSANDHLAMQYQVLAMKVCAMSARLHLEIADDENASIGLSKCVMEQARFVKDFVRKWLGSPAIYFHGSVSDEYLDRYLDIEGWLRGKRDVLPEIAREYRHHFWDDDAIKRLYTQIWGQRQLANPPFYSWAIPYAEALIENYQRLQGFELELKSMCLPRFAEWEAYDGESIARHDGYVMLVEDSRWSSG